MAKKTFLARCFMLLLLSISIRSIAQSQIDCVEKIKRPSASNLAKLNDYLSFIADQSKNIEHRKYYANEALHLFINNGESYEMNGARVEGSTIEIRTKYRGAPIKKHIKEYLNGLLNMHYMPISIVEATLAFVNMDDVVKVAENKYMVTCFIDKVFCGMKDGRAMYKDIAKRNLVFYIDQEQFNEIKDFTYLELIVDVVTMGK